ncbi:MAG: hypothetical protein K2W82_12705 [Candidatus Obscuribacterales bacterium]|nr:hypothetical protein [Candidatus Obscuribacterales bacterium]
MTKTKFAMNPLLVMCLLGIMLFAACYFSYVYLVEAFLVNYQVAASKVEDRIETKKIVSTCSGGYSQERIYLPFGANYISPGQLVSSWGLWAGCNPRTHFYIQVLSKDTVHSLTRAINKSRNKKIDYIQLGLTPEKIRDNLRKNIDSYYKWCRAYQLEMNDETLNASMQADYDITSYASGNLSIAIIKPQLRIHGHGSLPWSVNDHERHWYAYNQDLSLAATELLTPNITCDELWDEKKPQYYAVNQDRVWNNLSQTLIQKNARKIVLLAEAFPSNCGLRLADVTFDRYFVTVLKPVKQESMIDQVVWKIRIPNEQIKPNWNIPIETFLKNETSLKGVKWLKSWKETKYSPTVQIEPFPKIGKSDGKFYVFWDRKSWKQVGLDCQPDCFADLLYDGKSRGRLYTSSKGNKVFCWLEASPGEIIKYYKKYKNHAPRKEFLLSKRDKLPDELAKALEPIDNL